ncbi:MAG TPA: type II secretion system protein GspL [Casimicrobiaceae bacterium]|nr:type II secretion system protein GspL [Casimicrobiaceae bacterium]
MALTATTLRVWVDDPPEAGREFAWVLFDAAGGQVGSGRSAPSAWPAAERSEAVVAARHGRIVTLTLPPLPPGRIVAAARFALEDQLADAPDESHVAVGSERGSTGLRVAIVASSWMAAFVAASQRAGLNWDRAVLESDLALAPARGWRWCAASVGEPGFVRTHRGATIAVGPAQGDAPPAELALALARGGADAPQTVRVDAAGATPMLLDRARALTGVEFVAGTPWRWADAAPGAFAGAIDLFCERFGRNAARPALDFRRLLRPALWIAALAIGLHVAATLGQWVWLRWETTAIGRELTALAATAVPEFAAGTTAPALALAQRERDLKHRAGLLAGDDFLPLLARAAPVLSALPPEAIRSLTYADGHLLLDLQKIEPTRPAALQRELQRAGLVAIAAPTSNGARLRVGLN